MGHDRQECAKCANSPSWNIRRSRSVSRCAKRANLCAGECENQERAHQLGAFSIHNRKTGRRNQPALRRYEPQSVRHQPTGSHKKPEARQREGGPMTPADWHPLMTEARQALTEAAGLDGRGRFTKKAVMALRHLLPYVWQIDHQSDGHPLVLCGRDYKPVGVPGEGRGAWVRYSDFPGHCIKDIAALPAEAVTTLQFAQHTGYYFFEAHRAPWYDKHYARRLLALMDAHLTGSRK